MANTLLTIDMITQEAIMIFRNTNAFMQNINTEYDGSFGIAGAKIGQTLRLRLPMDYVVSNGPALSAQDTVEQSTTLTVATQRHVDLTFSSVEQLMKMDDYARRYLLPATNNLAGNVASTIMAGSEGGICNIVAAFDGTPGTGSNIITPTATEVLLADAKLADNSAPMMNHKFVLGPTSMARLTSSLVGLLNPQQAIGQQYRDGSVKDALGFTWMRDQTSINHTTGSFSAGGTVSTAPVDGVTTVAVSAITGTLTAGDIITFTGGVNAVNRVTKASTGVARQFVITAAAASGATSISIYPALVGPGVGYNSATGDGGQQYQTVSALPTTSSVVTLFNKPSEVYRKNIAFAPEAVTMVTADLEKPPMVESSRKEYDGISLRILNAYVPGTDYTVTRCDILFGYLYVRPEWSVILADAI